MDIHEAYKTLGLSEKATDQEIEKEYMKLVKRHKTNLAQGESEAVDIDSINAAYETIKTYRHYGTESLAKSETFKDKVEHFFRYYTLRTISIIALIAIVIGITHTVLEKRQEQKELASLPPANLDIMFFGSYINSGLTNANKTQSVLENNILTTFPSWNRVTTTINYSPLEVNDGSDIGIQQKSAAVIATEKPDMYIMDLEYFQIYVSSGMFYPLEELALSVADLAEEDKLHHAKTETDTTEHLYGIEITNHSIFEGVPHKEEARIVAAIRKDAKNKENALEFILRYSTVDD